MNAIDWGSFLVVAVVSIVSACLMVAVYSVGLRIWSAADTMGGKYSIADDGTIAPSSQGVPVGTRTVGVVRLVRSLAILCFAVSGAVVLWGIYLVIPQFH